VGGSLRDEYSLSRRHLFFGYWRPMLMKNIVLTPRRAIALVLCLAAFYPTVLIGAYFVIAGVKCQ
jgi:hypothetical protein